MDNVVIAGTGMTAFGMFPQRSSSDLAQEALSAALADAHISIDEVHSVYYSNTTEGTMAQQHSIRGEVALRDTGLLGRPITNVENACASGSTAFRLACQEVASGASEIALAIGAEKMSYPDKSQLLGTISSGTAIGDLPKLLERLGGDPSTQHIHGHLRGACPRSHAEQ